MPLKFVKCKRRFDVTVKIQAYQKHEWQSVYEGSMCVWSYGPSLRQMTDPIMEEVNIDKGGARISILYVREHEFEEYSPAQMGKMMAQEGFGGKDNPYVDINNDHADIWSEAFRKEQSFIGKKRG
jgi:hypothetical protein